MTDPDIPIGRRTVGLLGASAVGGVVRPPGAAAQYAGVAARPPPCAAGPGDITGLVLTGTGAPEASIVVFGQAFRPGELPRGAGLVARRAEGGALPLQADVTTRHPDGSARFAVLALAAPALRRGEARGVILSRGAAEPGGTAMADWDALGRLVLEITPGGGGTPWRADLPAMARAAGAVAWQSGGLARQVRVEAAVPAAAVGGAASLRLVVDLAVRRDGSAWVDLWLRNDIAMQPGGGTAAYSARLSHDGQEVLRFDGIRQSQYTGIGRAVHRRQGAAAPPPPIVHPDIAYLAEAGAIARYDVANGVDEAVLAEFARLVAAPAWQAPFEPRGLTTYMPTTGGRFDIGPATGWQAAWLVSGDARAASVAIGQAEAAGAIPRHFWDPRGGANGTGGWLDTRRWPGLWTDPRGGAPPRSLAQPIPTHTGWTPDHAHQPAVSLVPFLLTGRRAFLDEVLAQAANAVAATYPAGRNPSPAVGDVVVANGPQVRAAAWSLREVDAAGWICPDADPNAAYLKAAAVGNWSWLRSSLAGWTTQQGETHGRVPGENGDPTAMAPWQQDYFASTAAAAAARGNANARAVLSWMGNFLAGRFLSEARGFSPADGIAYRLATAPEGEPRRGFTTWAQIGAETRRRGWSAGGNWSQADAHYAQLAIASLAAMVDLLGDRASRDALAALLAAGPRGTSPADYRRSPTYAIVTRGTTRAGGRVSGCAPSSRSG